MHNYDTCNLHVKVQLLMLKFRNKFATQILQILKITHIYRKMYRHIFKMSLRASKSDLLNAFNITSIVELIENKTRNFMQQCLVSKYIELQFLSICIMYGL